jgi:hypothetical protein
LKLEVMGVKLRTHRQVLRCQQTQPWVYGVGKQLWLLGNGPARLFTRQVDAAGNSSDRSELDLVQASAGEAIEFSTNPLAPTLIAQLPESSEVLYKPNDCLWALWSREPGTKFSRKFDGSPVVRWANRFMDAANRQPKHRLRL